MPVKIYGERNNLNTKLMPWRHWRKKKKWRARKIRAGNEPVPGEIWAMLMVKQVVLFIQHYS